MSDLFEKNFSRGKESQKDDFQKKKEWAIQHKRIEGLEM